MTNNGAKPPVLNLDDLYEPTGVFQIDGRQYAIRAWDSLSLRERNRIGHIDERVRAIQDLEGAEADAVEEEYDAIVAEAVVMFTDMTREQAAAATKRKLRDALSHFLGQLRLRQIEMVTMAASQVKRASPPTGARSSQGSTATGRKRGRKSG